MEDPVPEMPVKLAELTLPMLKFENEIETSFPLKLPKL
jgi:hypothetical protein